MRPIAMLICAAVLLMFVSAGCADPHALQGGVKGPGLSASGQPVFATAPADGHYVIAFRPSGIKSLVSLPNSARFVRKGDVLGFRRSADGELLAVAGDDEISLGGVLTTAKYCCWYQQPEEAVHHHTGAITKAFRRASKSVGSYFANSARDYASGPHDADDDYIMHRLRAWANEYRHGETHEHRK